MQNKYQENDKFMKDGNIYTLIEINTYPVNPPLVGYRLKDLINDTPYFEVSLIKLQEEFVHAK